MAYIQKDRLMTSKRNLLCFLRSGDLLRIQVALLVIKNDNEFDLISDSQVDVLGKLKQNLVGASRPICKMKHTSLRWKNNCSFASLS